MRTTNHPRERLPLCVMHSGLKEGHFAFGVLIVMVCDKLHRIN